MKTVIIGLDGATFDVIRPLAGEGQLPVLSTLMHEGSSAPLISTILPNSFPGWASCTTGTSEGMHGVFSPFIKNPASYSVRAMSGRDIMTRTIWDYVTDAGGRSIVVNVPTTYPPEPLNGLMVTGMLTPGLESEFTFPASLKAELLAAVPGFLIEPARHPDRQVRAAEFRRATDMHERAVHYLMDSAEWDFLMVVFSVLDRAQHDFWADRDPTHPRHNPATPTEFRSFIDQTYVQLDSVIGRLLAKLPSEVRVLVVSDHGFCSELVEVRVNEVLAAAGLLKFKSGRTRRARSRLKEIREKIGRRLHPDPAGANVLEKKVRFGSAFLDEIDWKQTKAFFAQDKGIWVNVIEREPEGIVPEKDFDSVVEEASAALNSVFSPENQTPVFEKVLRRDEAFRGLYSDRLPDVVMIPRDDRYVYNERPGYNEALVPADSTTGTHSREGIFIAWGRGIESNASIKGQANLRDIAPTALQSLGLPLTEDMDGRSLAEVFSRTDDLPRQGSSYRRSRIDESGAPVYGEAEEAALRERLRALGYIE